MTMTQPIYTATAGPADPNAGARAKLYAGLAVITPLLGFLATFNIVTTEQGNAISAFITAAMGLLGVFGFGLAASKTNKQSKDGTFDAAPVNPAGDVFDALGKIKQQVDDTVTHATSQVAQATAAIQGAASMIPGGGAFTNSVLSGPVGDLIQAMTDRGESA